MPGPVGLSAVNRRLLTRPEASLAELTTPARLPASGRSRRAVFAHCLAAAALNARAQRSPCGLAWGVACGVAAGWRWTCAASG